jgi:hypothetical protein
MSVTLLVSTHALAGTNGVEVTDDTFCIFPRMAIAQ